MSRSRKDQDRGQGGKRCLTSLATVYAWKAVEQQILYNITFSTIHMHMLAHKIEYTHACTRDIRDVANRSIARLFALLYSAQLEMVLRTRSLKMLCSPALASFADAKFFGFRYSTFYLYIRSFTNGADTVCMFLTISACKRVRYSSRTWSEAPGQRYWQMSPESAFSTKLTRCLPWICHTESNRYVAARLITQI